MFWSANYITARELNCLLKDENVTLTQVLEADDILQECKADNKSLMQFLTKPKILAELITLITEEPPKNVELASQYRHASIACEVLTSHLSMLSDRLSMDVVQMNRLCDFINKDPPLNPLLASYFSKTVEMLLERGPKQDWYIYHIVCLRVLDFFKTRRDFLPNLLRHISTSAIADTFKYFIRLDDLFNKIIMEWFEEHQLLECLIQIVCGSYVPEPLAPAKAEPSPDQPEKGQHEASEKPHHNHTATHLDAPDTNAGTESTENNVEEAKEAEETSAEGQPAAGAGAEADAETEAEAEAESSARANRIAAIASANAAALLCDLILNGCAGDGCTTRGRTSWALVGRLQAAEGVRALLQGVFTAPPPARPAALVHAIHVLRALLQHTGGCEGSEALAGVEAAVAPHLPLLHQALLARPPRGRALGLPRLQVAALLARLARATHHDVCATLLTLGTPGVLVQLFLEHPDNNLLHAEVAAFLRHALHNPLFRDHYAAHLLEECDLLTKLLDVFEENEDRKAGGVRAGYMGHVVGMLRALAGLLDDGGPRLAPALHQRWQRLRLQRLDPLLQRLDTPLGGVYPSDNVYEDNDVTTPALDDVAADIGADDNELCASSDARLPGDLDFEDDIKAETDFLDLASQRFGDDMWEDSPEADELEEAEDEDDVRAARQLLEQASPWEGGEGGEGGAGGGEGWAQFDNPSPAFWAFHDSGAHTDSATQENMEENLRNLQLDGQLRRLQDSSVQLATQLLTAMTALSHGQLDHPTPLHDASTPLHDAPSPLHDAPTPLHDVPPGLDDAHGLDPVREDHAAFSTPQPPQHDRLDDDTFHDSVSDIPGGQADASHGKPYEGAHAQVTTDKAPHDTGADTTKDAVVDKPSTLPDVGGPSSDGAADSRPPADVARLAADDLAVEGRRPAAGADDGQR